MATTCATMISTPPPKANIIMAHTSLMRWRDVQFTVVPVQQQISTPIPNKDSRWARFLKALTWPCKPGKGTHV